MISTAEVDRKHQPWERIFRLVKLDLFRRCYRKFVEVPGDSYYSYKEIGDLSASELKELPLALRKQVLEWLLERHLAERGDVDLVEGTCAYRKNISNLTPEDVPALLEGYRYRVLEETHNSGELELYQKIIGLLEQGVLELWKQELLTVAHA